MLNFGKSISISSPIEKQDEILLAKRAACSVTTLPGDKRAAPQEGILSCQRDRKNQGRARLQRRLVALVEVHQTPLRQERGGAVQAPGRPQDIRLEKGILDPRNAVACQFHDASDRPDQRGADDTAALRELNWIYQKIPHNKSGSGRNPPQDDNRTRSNKPQLQARVRSAGRDWRQRVQSRRTRRNGRCWGLDRCKNNRDKPESFHDLHDEGAPASVRARLVRRVARQ